MRSSEEAADFTRAKMQGTECWKCFKLPGVICADIPGIDRRTPVCGLCAKDLSPSIDTYPLESFFDDDTVPG